MFVLSKRETQSYFIQIPLASFCEGFISSCVRFSIKLQTFNLYVYFLSHRVYFVVHICLLNPLITQPHPPLETSKGLIGFNSIFWTSCNFLKAVTFSYVLNCISLTFYLNCLILTGFRSKKSSVVRVQCFLLLCFHKLKKNRQVNLSCFFSSNCKLIKFKNQVIEWIQPDQISKWRTYSLGTHRRSCYSYF